MEYYDEVMELLDLVKNHKEDETQYKQLENYFLNESGKEMYLMMAEFLTSQTTFSFENFMHLLPIIAILFATLSSANEFITNEYLEYLFHISSIFNEEQNQKIYDFLIKTDTMKEDKVTQPFSLFLMLTCSDVDEKIAKMIKKPGDNFGKLPKEIQIAVSRAAIYNTEEMRSYGLERLAELLLKETRTKYQESGVLLVQKITSLSSPIKFFGLIVSCAPFFSTRQISQSAWQFALTILRKMNEEDRFHAIRVTLSDSNIPETGISALISELQREITKNKSGIFRSPHVTMLLNLIILPNVISSPAAQIEAFLTIVNFLQFYISIDKKYRCFQCLGTQNQKIIMDAIEAAKKGIAKAKKQSKRPKDEILKDMKKSNFGENMTIEDVEKSIKCTETAIKRAEFGLSSLEEVMKI